MTTPDFSKIWAASTPLAPYVFDDADYLDGWEFLGEIPPDRRMFDAWQNHADTKMQWLYQNTAYLLRQNNTAYQVGDIAFSASLPSNMVLQCTTAGTTAEKEPDFSGATIGGTVTDGTAVWTYMPLGTLSREITPAFNHRDVITTSGTYTAPVTGWYRITAKGGGGGGCGGVSSSVGVGGFGGGEGGTTIGFEYMSAGTSATVVIGAGGVASGGSTGAMNPAGNGGNSTVTVNGNTYTGGGGYGGAQPINGGKGGSGTIPGASGGVSDSVTGGYTSTGATGGGVGGAVYGHAASDGGGGCGGDGRSGGAMAPGLDGGDGFVWFEYFDTIQNP